MAHLMALSVIFMTLFASLGAAFEIALLGSDVKSVKSNMRSYFWATIYFKRKFCDLLQVPIGLHLHHMMYHLLAIDCLFYSVQVDCEKYLMGFNILRYWTTHNNRVGTYLYI